MRPPVNFSVLAICAVSLLSALCHVSSSCVDPSLNTTCLWYPNCLEAAHPCGPDGYALSYGEHYCSAFSNASNVLTRQGQVWRDKTLLCLQEELVPFLNVSISCKVTLIFYPVSLQTRTNRKQDLRSRAFDSHAHCYVASGVCALGVHDWNAIRLIVCGHSATCEGQVWHGYFWKQFAEVAELCV